MSNVHVVPFGDRLTPQQLIAEALADADDAEIVVISFLGKDGDIRTSWSTGSLLKRLGLLDFCKLRMMDIATDETDRVGDEAG